MKVDAGTCAVCGAKNSKFVQSCYKCGAALPWSPNYIAPQAPGRPEAPVQPGPVVPPAAPAFPPVVAPTVAVPGVGRSVGPDVNGPPQDISDILPGTSASSGALAEKVKKGVTLPAWVLGLGLVACVLLGMASAMVWGKRAVTMPGGGGTQIPAPVPSSSGPASSRATATNPDPSVPTAAPSAAATPVPALAPTVRSGPGFDEVDAKMDDRGHDLTEAQKQAYWDRVRGTTVQWQGMVQEARLDGGGTLSLRCGKQTLTSDVQISLDGTQKATLGLIGKGQVVTVSGTLSEHTSFGYGLSQGRIVARN